MSFEIYGINKKVCEDLDALKKKVWADTLAIGSEIDGILEEKEMNKKAKLHIEAIKNIAEHLKGYAGAIK